MTECRCKACAPVEAESHSEAYRLACEARRVMRMEKGERKKYYELVAQMRGADCAMQLRDAVNAAWRQAHDLVSQP